MKIKRFLITECDTDLKTTRKPLDMNRNNHTTKSQTTTHDLGSHQKKRNQTERQSWKKMNRYYFYMHSKARSDRFVIAIPTKTFVQIKSNHLSEVTKSTSREKNEAK